MKFSFLKVGAPALPTTQVLPGVYSLTGLESSDKFCYVVFNPVPVQTEGHTGGWNYIRISSADADTYSTQTVGGKTVGMNYKTAALALAAYDALA